MQKTLFTLRGIDITVSSPTVAELVKAHGEEKVLHALVTQVVYHKIGSRVEKMKEDGAEVQTEWDLADESLWNAPGTRRSTYPVPAQYMEKGRKALMAKGLIASTKLKDIDVKSEDFAKIVKAAEYFKSVDDQATKDILSTIG